MLRMGAADKQDLVGLRHPDMVRKEYLMAKSTVWCVGFFSVRGEVLSCIEDQDLSECRFVLKVFVESIQIVPARRWML